MTARRQDRRGGRLYTVDGAEWGALRRLGPNEAPSVTTVLGIRDKPALKWWAAQTQQAHDAEVVRDMLAHGYDADAIVERLTEAKPAFLTASKDAMDLGTLVHEAIERRVESMLACEHRPDVALPEAGRLCLMAWEDWAKAVEFDPLASELTVWSRNHRYAGTADALAHLNGADLGLSPTDVVVLDWKTSKAGKSGSGIYPEMLMQVTAYADAYREMVGLNAMDPWAGVVRVPKTLDDLDRLSGTVEVKLLSPEEQVPYRRRWLATLALWYAEQEV